MTDSTPPLGISFSPPQRQIVESPLNSKLFVSGPMGTGKTTAAVERMRYLFAQGVPGESVLMLAAQRSPRCRPSRTHGVYDATGRDASATSSARSVISHSGISDTSSA